MSQPVSIDITVLKDVFALIMNHLQELEGDASVVEKDYFWAVPVEQLYNPYSEPVDFTVGQISECFANLREIQNDPTSVTSYALVWLAEVIKSIGLTVVI